MDVIFIKYKKTGLIEFDYIPLEDVISNLDVEISYFNVIRFLSKYTNFTTFNKKLGCDIGIITDLYKFECGPKLKGEIILNYQKHTRNKIIGNILC
jgi:hypothetical protein